jgi:hypothetical protein
VREARKRRARCSRTWSSAGLEQRLEAGSKLLQLVSRVAGTQVDQKRRLAGVGGGAAGLLGGGAEMIRLEAELCRGCMQGTTEDGRQEQLKVWPCIGVGVLR